jgi:hypothetical protein
MTKRTVYISIYKKDYIRHKIKPELRLTQKPSCKRLSIPKYIKTKISKNILIPWK